MTNRITGLFAKGYTVFNIEQVDGCKLPKRFEPKLSHNERIAHADSFFGALESRSGTAEIAHSIGLTLPKQCTCRDSISSRTAWITTACWPMKPPIGLRTRPDVTVNLGKRFGDDAYAVEELIAELARLHHGPA